MDTGLFYLLAIALPMITTCTYFWQHYQQWNAHKNDADCAIYPGREFLSFETFKDNFEQMGGTWRLFPCPREHHGKIIMQYILFDLEGNSHIIVDSYFHIAGVYLAGRNIVISSPRDYAKACRYIKKYVITFPSTWQMFGSRAEK